MSHDYDNGFKAAQRSYDNQLPPEYDEEESECTGCGGDGTMFDSDSGEVEVCKKCNGEGVRYFTAEQRRIIQQHKEDDAREDYDPSE